MLDVAVGRQGIGVVNPVLILVDGKYHRICQCFLVDGILTSLSSGMYITVYRRQTKGLNGGIVGIFYFTVIVGT